MSNITSERWHSSKLGSLFKILKGSIDPQQNPREKLEYYSIPGFDKNGSSSYVYGADIESNKTLITEPSILVSKLNPRKPRVQIVTKAEKYRQCASTEFMAYAPRHPGTDLKFFKYYFVSEYFSNRLQLVATGSTNSHVRVTPSETLRWKVPVPPLPEQQKIAAILSSVDDVIEKTRAQIDKLKDLKTGMMQELLTKGIGHTEFRPSPLGLVPRQWEVLYGEQLLRLGSGLSPSQVRFDELGDVLFMKVDDFNHPENSTSIRATKLKFSRSSNPKAKVYPKGAIVIAKRGAAISKNRVRLLSAPTTVDTNLMIIEVRSGASPTFVRYFLEFFNLNRIADTTSVPQINNFHLNELLLPVPPLDEQWAIAKMLDSAQEKIDVVKAARNSLTSLKKALMQDLLTGKVRVKLNNSDSTTAAAQSADSTEEQQYDHA